MRSLVIASLGLAGCVLIAPARADDLTKASKFLCAAASVSACCDDGQCATGTAADLDIPQFIEVDLVAKRVNTTKTSGLNRTSPIESVKRADGQIILHGVENGRAFTFVIAERSGELSAAIVAPGCSVMAFGSCMPLPAAN